MYSTLPHFCRSAQTLRKNQRGHANVPAWDLDSLLHNSSMRIPATFVGTHRRDRSLRLRITPPVCSASRITSKIPLGKTLDLFPPTEV